MTEKDKVKKLEKDLLWKAPHVATCSDGGKQQKSAEKFCEGYKQFLNKAKTERECSSEIVSILAKAGYKPFDAKKKYKAGDKVYYVNRGKAVIATTWGMKSIDEGVRLVASHIDSPRLDIKPTPLYEEGEMSLLKTHYYGGIKKYQWAAVPLSMHGVIFKGDGKAVELNVGEDPDDPIFYISDILPHLSYKQNEKRAADAIEAEQLNVVIGSWRFECDDVKNPFKLYAMNILNEKYGITEKDFVRAEIEMVPAMKARDVGFDRSMIAAYGHDDKVCAYPSLMAELETVKPEYTTVSVFTDKEEIGSEGNTGLNSGYLYDYICRLADNKKADSKDVFAHTKALSADVSSVYDPDFSEQFDKHNISYLNHGPVLEKYTGARGKSSASDANAEFLAEVSLLLDKAGVHWQTGELGAVDKGGGGTVAKYLAAHNMEVVDFGTPVLSMHAPYELVTKTDVYNTYLGCRAFLA